MKKLSVMALVLSLCTAAAANAAIVTFTLDLTTAGQFELRAKASDGDNAGIATYGVVLTPASGVTVTALDHKSARAGAAESSDGSLSGSMGFTVVRSADGPANLGIRGGQNTIDPTPFLIYGYGQTPGSFATVQNGPATPLGSNEGNNWLAEPVIASGTYTGGASAGGPALTFDLQTVDLLALTFNDAGSTAVAPATLVTRIIIPEPATVAIAGMGLIGLVGFARRRKA